MFYFEVSVFCVYIFVTSGIYFWAWYELRIRLCWEAPETTPSPHEFLRCKAKTIIIYSGTKPDIIFKLEQGDDLWLIQRELSRWINLGENRVDDKEGIFFLPDINGLLSSITFIRLSLQQPSCSSHLSTASFHC